MSPLQRSSDAQSSLPFDADYVVEKIKEMSKLGVHMHKNHTGKKWTYMGQNTSVFSISTVGTEEYALSKGGSEKSGLSSHEKLKILAEERPAFDIIDDIKREIRKIPLFDRDDLRVTVGIGPISGKTPKAELTVDRLNIHPGPLVPQNLRPKIIEKLTPLIDVDTGGSLRIWRILDTQVLAQSPETALLKYAVFKKPELLTATSVDGVHPHFPDISLIEQNAETWEKFCQIRPSADGPENVLLRRRQ